MKTLYISLFTLLSTFLSYANSHIIVKQNGEKIEANYITTKNNVVIYTVSGSNMQHEISVLAIEKVVDKTTNQNILTNKKSVVSGSNAFKSVRVIDNNQTQGLKVGEELTATIHKVKGQSSSTWIEWSENRLKREAASKGYPFIVIVSQTDSKIKAVGYTY